MSTNSICGVSDRSKRDMRKRAGVNSLLPAPWVAKRETMIIWRNIQIGGLANPAYGGAYAYGKSEQIVRYDDGKQRKETRRKPTERRLVLLPNAHEGFVSWEQFEQIQRTIAGNNHGWQRAGAVHNGQALLAGLLRCRRCGHKLVVSYSGTRGSALRYACQRGVLDNGQPRCIGFGGAPVDSSG